MPPKLRFTRETIIQKGFSIVRRKGWKALSARSLAAELGSSPMPIYSCFNAMQELETEIIKMIIDCLQTYMTRRVTGDPWHDHGIGYVRFADEEPMLFLAINDASHFEESRQYGQRIWDACTRSLTDYPPFQGLSDEQIYNVQLKRWMLAHGFAFHACYAPPGSVGVEKIILHIREGSMAILEGLKHLGSKRPHGPEYPSISNP